MPETLTSYQQALDYLYGRIDFERPLTGGPSSRDFKLERMRELLDRLGNPHEKISAVHVAGTKGKGSTAAMIASVLTAAGIPNGLFTSPHISSFEERMTVNGVLPDVLCVVDLVNRIRPAVDQMDRHAPDLAPTFFEITTAMAWLHFLDSGAEIAVLEVGLGGRLDSTNLCRPLVSLITNISADHTEILGESLAEIAREKAGIIKCGVPVVSGVTSPEPQTVIRAICRESGVPLRELNREFRYRYHARPPAEETETSPDSRGKPSVDVQTIDNCYTGLELVLAGEHQAANAALAVAAVECLRQSGHPIDGQSLRAGLKNVRWPLRLEWFPGPPAMLLDAAHNPASAEAVVKSLEEFTENRRRILVFGGTRGKDVGEMLQRLVPAFDAVVLTRYVTNPRAVPLQRLQPLVHAPAGVPVVVTENPAEARRAALSLAGPRDVICVTGSFFLAAEMRELILKAAPNPEPELRLPVPAVLR